MGLQDPPYGGPITLHYLCGDESWEDDKDIHCVSIVQSVTETVPTSNPRVTVIRYTHKHTLHDE